MENYLDVQHFIDEEKLKEISLELKSGKTVLFPTETVYGIGTNGLDDTAVKKLYEIKGRNFNNPINLLVNDMGMVDCIAKDITDLEYKLMQAFFPGPFTIILKKRDIVPNILTAGLDTIGVRMPDNEIAQKLIEYAKVPIAAPSANISGKLSGTRLEDIVEDFSDKIDYIIDGGITNLGIESTIVKVIDNIPHILRPGSITPEQIKQIAGNVVVKNTPLPSSTLKHYQLNIKSVLIYSNDTEKMINKVISISKKHKNVVIMSFSENTNNYINNRVIDIGSKSNLAEVSKNIFLNLRKAEELKPEIILIEGCENKDLGLALMDRLLNACNHNYIEL